jgi:hypothetical protein
VSDDAITTRTSVYTRRADGIIVQRNLANLEQSIEDAHENVAAYNRLAAGVAHPLLVDARALHAQARGVREVYAAPEAMMFTVAIALLTNMSGPGRVIANVFITLSSPKAPTRLFAAEPEAIAWLLKIARARALTLSR